MTGRFRKLEVNHIKYTGGGGLFCNNKKQEEVYNYLLSNYGLPNGNFINQKENNWKYILEYENYYITIYNFYNNWTVGFLEENDIMVDYGKIYALSKMLYDLIKKNVFNEDVYEPMKKRSSRRRIKVGS